MTANIPIKKVGIAGLGAIGSAVAKALCEGITGFTLVAASESAPEKTRAVPDRIPLVDFETLARECDLVIECLPPAAVPALVKNVFMYKKDLVLISACAFILFPELIEQQKQSTSRIFVPSGALAGLDGVQALKELGIQRSVITSTKHPRGFIHAPYVDKMRMDMTQIRVKTKIFSGNTFEAAQGFPANVNVAATLSLAGIGPEKTQVELWADPDAQSNRHEITVTSPYSTLCVSIENLPDPQNPKSSVLAAQSIVALLRKAQSPLVII